MSSLFLRRCFCSIVVLCGLPSVVFAQKGAGDAARGQGAYLNGAGWYNLNTAKANSVNTDAAIRWKQDLRKIQSEKRDLEARTAAGKKLRLEEVKQRQQERERQLRVAPTGADVQAGEALNVLLYDLTDPAITSSDWQSKSVALPEGMSVKDLIFRFTPLSGSSTTSAALSKGVIALSRLAVSGEAWPTPLQLPEVERERLAYESAYATVQGEIRDGKFVLKSVQEMDKSLDALKAKVNSTVPVERGFRTEAGKFVEDLKNSTKMFDAATIDYAREILVDTKDHEATTVAELVAFMLKYRLQFASAERSPDASALYTKLHDALRQQNTMLGIKLPDAHPAPLIAPFNAEQANTAQATWAKSLGTKVVEKNSIGMDLVLIPPGEFEMGSRLPVKELVGKFSKFGAKEEYFTAEYPAHRVSISRPFYLGQHEVTIGEFRKFVVDAGYKTDAESDSKGGIGWSQEKSTIEIGPKYNWKNVGFAQADDHPVVIVSWNDAQKFCKWLSRQDGHTYRLPTEAEWEYACKAGTNSLWSNGDDSEGVATMGNIADGTAKGKLGRIPCNESQDGFVFTAPVNQFKPNSFGLFDMHGNVIELCEDIYDRALYERRSGKTVDPLQTSGGELRVLRGGGWIANSMAARSDVRNGNMPNTRIVSIGFRVVRTP